MTRRQCWLTAVGMVLWFVPAAAYGQGAAVAGGAVNGVGTVEIKRPAQRLRMNVRLIAKGKDLKDALTKLDARKAAAQKSLDELSAVQDSIEIGEPEIQEGDPHARRQMEMMLRQRNQGKKKKTTNLVVPVTVVCSLTTDWELSGQGSDLLAAAYELEQKIKAADLGGAADAGQLSPEEQELLEEMQENYGGLTSGEELKPGEPVFVYVSHITEVERDTALQTAFQKAKDQAALLAKAASLQLGSVTSLSSHGSSPWARGLSQDYARMQQLQMAFGSGDDDTGDSPPSTEALGSSPTAVKHILTVAASFEAKP